MAVDEVQLERLLPKFEAQVQYLGLYKPGHVEQACNSCTGEAEVERSRVLGHPLLQNEFSASLGYMKACLNKNTKKAGKMAQQVKIAVEPGELSSVSRTHLVEGENRLPQAVL